MIKDTTVQISKESNDLLESIDFFSQNLSFEQVISYGYQFVHDMLKLESSGIFVLEEGAFVLKSSIDADFKHTSFEETPQLKTVATKFGRGMQRELKIYFYDDFIDDDHVTMAMPIIVKDQTLAFIVCKNKALDLSDPGLALIFNGINQLLNKGAESARNYEQFKSANSALDRKIFNLLFINHSTKALMSEVDLERLYTLCIDVIRELTASSVTSFGLYDANKEVMTLRGFKDIVSFDDQYCELEMIHSSQKPSQAVYHIKDDYNALTHLFKKPEKFVDLKAEYVVLLIKERVLGFVTLGKTVSNKGYTEELLGQVESLISSIYIAIKNAQHIATINTQKNEIFDQLESINQLNHAIKNINSCETIEELAHIALQTISYGFDIRKGMVVIQEGEAYRIQDTMGIELQNHTFKISDTFRGQCFDQTYFEPVKSDLSDLVGAPVLEGVGHSNCFISVPLSTTDSETTCAPLGFLIVFESKHALKKSQIVTLESIANSVAPIVHQMQEKDEVLNTYVPNARENFLRKLKRAFDQRDNYYIDFKVYYKQIKQCIFEPYDLRAYKGIDIDVVESMLFYISHDALDHEDLFDGHIIPWDLQDLKGKVKDILF